MEIDDIRELNGCRMRGDGVGANAVLARMGDPSSEQLAERALEGLSSPDRNVRFQMVRLLADQRVPAAAQGIKRALDDPSRRIRRLATRLSVPFVSDPAIETRLRQMAEDDDEIGKLRGTAFMALSSGKVLSIMVVSFLIPATCARCLISITLR